MLIIFSDQFYDHLFTSPDHLFNQMKSVQATDLSEEVRLEKTVYHSFLLRLWLVKQNGKISWRASLENPHSQQQQFFACLDDLIFYLQQLNLEMETREDAC